MTDTEKISQLGAKMEALQERLISLEQAKAVDAVHRQNVERRLEKIEAGITRLAWMIIGGIISAALVFILNGGLAQ